MESLQRFWDPPEISLSLDSCARIIRDHYLVTEPEMTQVRHALRQRKGFRIEFEEWIQAISTVTLPSGMIVMITLEEEKKAEMKKEFDEFKDVDEKIAEELTKKYYRPHESVFLVMDECLAACGTKDTKDGTISLKFEEFCRALEMYSKKVEGFNKGQNSGHSSEHE